MARSAALLALLAMVLAGCGRDDPATVRSPAPSPTLSATASPTGGRPPSPSPSPSPSFGGRVVEIRVAGGKVVSGERSITVRRGTQVLLVVTSDAADEVHVHTYDLTARVQPGTPARLAFAARIAGVFEVELEEAKLRLVTLRVTS